MVEKQERNEEVELKALFSHVTMDLIASVGFGAEINSLKNPSDPFVKHAKMASHIDNIRLQLFIIAFFPLLFPFWNVMADAKLKKSVDFFDRFVDVAFKNRKEENAKGPKDFLQLMVDAEKNNEGEEDSGGLTVDDVKAQTLVFLLAGYETVSSVLFILAVHPECCKKIQEEIDEKLGPHAVPNYDNVGSLEYLNMCISETLRMYPPGFVLDRQIKDDIEIDGFKFLKGRSVMVPVYNIHHDPQYWPQPEEFIPERFTAENKAARHPFVYLPFGQGPRNCVGLRLAQLEMNIILGSILQRLTPVPCDKTVYPVTLEGILIRAKDGLWVKLEKRRVRETYK